jgi:hypothetical protein
MTSRWGQDAQDEGPSPQRQAFRSGTLLIIGVGIFLLVGWLFYRQTLPPTWLRDFSEAVALHASADPNPPEPEDIRQVSPPSNADSPYICAGKIINEDWDQLFAVTARQNLASHPFLSRFDWPEYPLEHYVDLLSRDERYQLLILVRGQRVVDAQLYFTFWGDIAPIAQTEGFVREDAVFTSASLNGLYIVSPAGDVPAGACK